MILINKKTFFVEATLNITVIVHAILLFVSVIFGRTDSINYYMYISNYLIGFLIIINLAFKGVNKHFLAIAFFSCFLLFLMGQKPFEPHYNVYLTFVRLELNTEQYFVFSSILFLGLVVTYYAYCIFSDKSSRCNSVTTCETTGKYRALKPVLFLALLVTLPCALYMQAKIVLVRGSMAYTSGYLVNVDVPSIIKIGYYVYSTIVLLYLALKPSKRELYFVLGSYVLIEGGFQLIQGRRALFASTAIFVAWYLIKYRNYKGKRWKNIIKYSVLLSGLVVVLFVVEQMRDSKSTALSFQLVRRLLVSTGGSDSVIANTIARKDSFPSSGLSYLLDPISNNIVGNILFGRVSSGQGLLYLQQHNSFSHWLSYMTEKSLYLSGHGMGSSYLAEVYLAFGIMGIPLVSIVLGWIINKLNCFEFTDNIFLTGVVFYIVKRLFTLPRDGLLSWTSNLVYLVFTYILIYPFYYMYCGPGKTVTKGKGGDK